MTSESTMILIIYDEVKDSNYQLSLFCLNDLLIIKFNSFDN